MTGRRARTADRRGIPVVLALCCLLGACSTMPRTPGPGASAQTAPRSDDFISHDADPFHRFNKSVFTLNRHLDHYVLRPAARAYASATPLPVRRGVTDFFSNLRETTAIANDVLQGRLRRLTIDVGRFVINSTIGVLGLVDVATPLGLRAKHQDFGMTLARWGVHSGPYLVLPLFGPSDVRDAVGLGAGWYTDPTTYLSDTGAQWGLLGLNAVNTRAQYLNSGNVLEQAAGGDEYDFVREAYRQKRQYQLSNGHAPPAPPLPGP
ncbi:MAG: MlaA family lipoprotein [Acidiferrobacteraceae bacterium]